MTTFTVIDDLSPLVEGTDWAEVELADHRGRGIAAWFPLAPSPTGADPMSEIERLVARPDPLLAAIAEYGIDDGEGFVVWSGDLDDTLATLSGPLSMAEIVTLADVLLAGFERLHAAGFVHPGITPDVVRLVSDERGRVMPEVIGLGLPWHGRTTRDDLVDIGVLLYRLSTGAEPFDPTEPRDHTTEAPEFSVVRPGVVAPVAFEAAVLRSIGPAERRFVTAGEMRQALAAGPARRSGFMARPAAGTNPHMRRALTTNVVGLEGLLAPEAVPAPGDALVNPNLTPEPRRLGLVPALGLAAATLLVGFLLGRATSGGGDEPAQAALAAAPETSSAPGSVASTSPPAPTTATPPTPATPHATEPRVAGAGEAVGGGASKAEPSAPAPSDTAPVEPAPAPAAAETQPAPPQAVTGTTRLQVVSDPPGATVLVRGKKILEKAPFTIEVTPDWLPIELVFDKKRHFPRREFVDKLTGSEMTVTVKLKPR